MATIYQHFSYISYRVASESEEISSTTVASTDDTICSKCEIKRNAKRTAIKVGVMAITTI